MGAGLVIGSAEAITEQKAQVPPKRETMPGEGKPWGTGVKPVGQPKAPSVFDGRVIEGVVEAA